MTGTTIFTVSRTLSSWEAQGLIESGRERVLVRDTQALTAIAEDLPPG
jgi:CRP/FNR family transcriptional regulator, nitrogen oxide reductase regulator